MRPPRAMWATAVAVTVAGLLAGCGGPSERELAAEREAAQERAFDEIDDAPVWIGTVLAFEDTYYDPITFDYGGRYEVPVDVARIMAVEDCDPAAGSANTRAFTASLREKAPVGARLALVRSEDEFGTRDSEGFLRRLRPDGTPDMDAPSINEEMVAAGVAVPDPQVALRERYGTPADDLDAVLARQRTEMSAVDFENWSAFVAAHRTADEQRVGPAGACADYAVEQERQRERDDREAEARQRRFEVGPDGRRGTADDFTDVDDDGDSDAPSGSGGSGGGGGFDVPDSLCPTRFC